MFKARQRGGGGPKNLLKLKDGDKIVGVFRGEVHTFYQHWMGTHSEPCTRATGCKHCQNGDKGSFKFRVNFIVSENGNLVAKVFQGGTRVYDSLVALSKDCEFETQRVSITRSGSTKDDTSYMVMPVLKGGELTKDDIKAVSAVKLNALDGAEAEEETAA